MGMRALLIRRRERKEAAFLLRMVNAFILAISLYMFLIGVWKFNNCSGKPYLPLLMIIIALLVVVDRLIFWRSLVNKTKFEDVFPWRYFVESTETIKKWEETRLRSSSRTLLWLMIAVRAVLIVG
ncbi:unnamed protein product [Caenorhabditis nigoni]